MIRFSFDGRISPYSSNRMLADADAGVLDFDTKYDRMGDFDCTPWIWD